VYILRLDGHCKPDPDYFAACLAVIESDESIGCVGGRLKTTGEGRSGASIALAQSSSFGVGNAEFRLSGATAEVDTVAFGIYRSTTFEDIGMFDEELIRNQDDELNLRLRQSGKTIIALGTTQCEYFSRSSIPKLWRQYNQYGRYKVAVYRKRRCAPTLRSLAPVALVVYVIAASLIALWARRLSGLWGLSLVPIYVLGILSAGAFAASRAKPRVERKLLVGLCAITMHVAYGLGFLRGLVELGHPRQRDMKLSR
jgi:GT2 family glycosyltransferase